MIDISTAEILANVKNFPGSRHKFPGKQEVQNPQISQKIYRPDFPGGNTTAKKRRRGASRWRQQTCGPYTCTVQVVSNAHELSESQSNFRCHNCKKVII